MIAIASRAGLWWTILRTSLEERLAYRADFALGTLMRFLPVVTQILLWAAIFEAAGDRQIAGFNYQDMVAYYLVVMISRAFSSMPTLASSIALQIRNGEIKKFLVQPVDMIGFLLLMRVAWKLVYYIVAIGPFALVFYLCRGYFDGWPDAATMIAGVASLVMAFLLGYFLEVTIGLIGFWFLEVTSLLFIYMLLNFLLSGHMFPLGLLPDSVELWVRALPLQFLAGFPTEVFLGKVTGEALLRGLWIQLMWVGVFLAASRIAYHYGVKRYSAFGG